MIDNTSLKTGMDLFYDEGMRLTVSNDETGW